MAKIDNTFNLEDAEGAMKLMLAMEIASEIDNKFDEVYKVDANLALALIPTLIDKYADYTGEDAVELAKRLTIAIEKNHIDNPELYK